MKKILFLGFLVSLIIIPAPSISVAAICLDLGGTCQNISQPCSSPYKPNICPGTADNIQCCVSDSGSRLGGVTPDSSKTISIPNPLKTRTFSELIDRIVNWLLIIGAPILALFIIIGAFQIMTSGGSPDKITTGRKTITYAVVGYALLLLSKSATLIINGILGVK